MFHCTRMEDFGAQSTSAVAFCREKASKADMLVGLIGMRRGWEPDNDEQNRSITEIEQDAARDAGRKRYLWVSPENIPIPGNIPESPDAYQRQIQFRKRVMGAGDVIVAQDGFAQPELLAADIVTQLVTHVSTSELILAVRQDLTLKGRTSVDEQVPAITAAVARLAADNEIDPLNIPDKLTGADLNDWEDKLRTRAEALETHWLAEKKNSAELWRHIGALAFLHDTDKALSAYSKATELDPRDLSGWRYLGELQFRLGNIRGAEDSFRTQVQLGRQLKDRRAEALGNLRLGWIERHRGQFSDARKLTEKALTISKEIGWTEGQARATTNLGNIQERLGQHADAAKSYSDALALNRALGRKQGLAIVYGNLGILQQGRGEPAAAEQSFRNSLKINKELERTDGIADAACTLGE
jgi:tetratricopeptide (TPR) repeat protein